MSDPKRTPPQAQAAAPQPNPERFASASHRMAAGMQLPPMQPQRPTPPRQAIERPRVEGQAPIQGLGAPQPFKHTELVNVANQLFEQYKQDPAQVDPTFVQIIALQTTARFGTNFQELDDLARRFENRMARLEELAEIIAGDREGPAPAQDAGGRASRLERIRNRRGGANGRSPARSRTRLRGRGRA